MPWIPRERVGADQLPSPVKLPDEELPLPTRAPTLGEHTEEVLVDVLGYDAEHLAALRRAGALGARKSVVYGKSVSVRVYLGGRRTSKKKSYLSRAPLPSTPSQLSS